MAPTAWDSAQPRACATARRTIPLGVWIIAAIAPLLHLAPFWRAQAQTPSGWTFTGNLRSSPDFMQYRAWMRQTQESGVLVANTFTSEPNPPHLPVPLYYVVGRIAHATGITPETVFAYVGAVLAPVFTIVLFLVVRLFMESGYQAWWTYLSILVGGGLGAYLRLLARFDWVKDNPLLDRFVVKPAWGQLLFEDYRGHYLFVTLFDTHFLLNTLVALASVVCLYRAVRQLSVWRLLLTALCFTAMTLLHLYEGITFTLVAAAVTWLCGRKRVAVRPAAASLVAASLAVAAALAVLWMLYRSSGLPVTQWRASSILFSTLMIAYPLAWGLIAFGLFRYWQNAGLKECFLLGWILGCTALTLSGPFYPYPDRGTMTLQIPLHIVAASIYFSRWPRLTLPAALVAGLVMGVSPLRELHIHWKYSAFDPALTYAFASSDQRRVVDLLKQRASAGDVLLADLADLLWLAPEYPGRHYCAHFFLTVDYPRKRVEVLRFLESDPVQQAAFLQEKGIRFLYVTADRNPVRFTQVPGLAVLESGAGGWLFEYSAVPTALPAPKGQRS